LPRITRSSIFALSDKEMAQLDELDFTEAPIARSSVLGGDAPDYPP